MDTYKNVQSTKKTILFSASQGSKEDPGVFQEEVPGGGYCRAYYLYYIYYLTLLFLLLVVVLCFKNQTIELFIYYLKTIAKSKECISFFMVYYYKGHSIKPSTKFKKKKSKKKRKEQREQQRKRKEQLSEAEAEAREQKQQQQPPKNQRNNCLFLLFFLAVSFKHTSRWSMVNSAAVCS